MATLRGDELGKIAIVGGGSAGYLAALTLRAIHPNVEITLIESTNIPIIGVGEATTSEIVPFLHTVLGFKPSEFYRKVRPTWKLGIKFVWGPAQEPFFNYPFDRGPLLESYVYDGHARSGSLVSALMTEDRSAFLPCNGSAISLIPDLPFAYHLDNRRFVQYLQEKATERNIRRLDVEIVDVRLLPDRETVDCLITSDGSVLKYDFYIDCTGFRSVLLEQKLGSPFISYGSSLFADTALVANAAHDGVVRPYTAAETMNHGWCWRIPQVDEDHLGYVFSSAFCSEDQALAEMREKHPGIHDPWTVRFRSGRHAHFVKGNVAAIGNSYGFVEPLESTAIFVICRQCLLLALNLSAASSEADVQEWLNMSVGNMWDYLRWFLGVHYRFNTRISSQFWRACQVDADITGADHIVSLYRNAAPLSYDCNGGERDHGHSINGHTFNGHNFGGHRFDGHNLDGYRLDPRIVSSGGHNFDAFGYDVMLFGQGVPAQRRAPRQSREQHLAYCNSIKSVVTEAMPQAEALNVLLRTEVDVLASEGWVPRLADSMMRVCRQQSAERKASDKSNGQGFATEALNTSSLLEK